MSRPYGYAEGYEDGLEAGKAEAQTKLEAKLERQVSGAAKMLEQRDDRIAELEAKLAEQTELADNALFVAKEMEAKLERIGALVHHGGLLDMTITEQLSEIRSITLPHWDRDECDRLQKLRHGEE